MDDDNTDHPLPGGPLPPGYAAYWDERYERHYFVGPDGESIWTDPRKTTTRNNTTAGGVVSGTLESTRSSNNRSPRPMMQQQQSNLRSSTGSGSPFDTLPDRASPSPVHQRSSPVPSRPMQPMPSSQSMMQSFQQPVQSSHPMQQQYQQQSPRNNNQQVNTMMRNYLQAQPHAPPPPEPSPPLPDNSNNLIYDHAARLSNSSAAPLMSRQYSNPNMNMGNINNNNNNMMNMNNNNSNMMNMNSNAPVGGGYQYQPQPLQMQPQMQLQYPTNTIHRHDSIPTSSPSGSLLRATAANGNPNRFSQNGGYVLNPSTPLIRPAATANPNNTTPRPTPSQPLPTLKSKKINKSKLPIEDDLYHPPPPRTICCNLFRTRSGCHKFFCVFTLLLLTALGLLIFFLFPRSPTITLLEPKILNDVSVFQTFGRLENATTNQPFQMAINLGVDFTVQSSNYINVDVSRLRLTGSLVSPTASPGLDAASIIGTLEDISFPSMRNVSYTLPMSIKYAVTKPSTWTQLSNEDPVIKELVEACGFRDRGTARDLKLGYTATLEISLISWLGIRPTINGERGFKCPLKGFSPDTGFS
ncbi:hypothetical protein HDV05_005094 [Chytridiales sp. JEL 0842]|nr:hypothetical protein HDV05_005094 [Chytridiales sp. JEL 0842]